MIGQAFGPYRIVAKIGAGGMGEVYRAHDSRLNRDVAIKVLPASFASDAERLQRFELEAQAAGRLNHPNVLTVYDVGTQDAAPYLVTELLDGETLRERLSPAADRGSASVSLPLRKALDIGRQIALGLAAAHSAGIVHRDLKPENIFLTTDGRAKILDFGLARMAEPLADAAGAATTLQVTNPGTVLGTVGYMSPEQVRGRQADTRSDLFALGAILFEMASGRRAFQRDSAADSMAAILKEDPPEIASPGHAIPPAVERVIRRCLEKNPDERFQSARDLAFAIDALNGSASGSILGAAAVVDSESTGTKARRRGVSVPLVAAGLLAAAVAGAAVGRFVLASSGETAARPYELRQLTFGGDEVVMPALAPDGQTFAFTAAPQGNADIFVQRVGGEAAINLTKDSPAGDLMPAFSPDGRQIAFRSERSGGGIFVMGATGESVRRLTSEGFNPSWSADGKQVVYSTEGILVPTGRTPPASLWRVDVATGQKTKIHDGDAVQPACSPNGKLVAFWGLPGASGRRAIMTLPLAGGTPTILVEDTAMNWNPVWALDGRSLYFLSDREPPSNVWRIPVNPDTGAAAGPATRVTLSTASHVWLSSASSAGMAFSVASQTTILERRPVTLASATFGATSEVMRTARQLGSGAVSPDGRSIVLMATDATEDLIVMNTDGTAAVRLTNDAYRDRMPSWSRDSSTIYFASDRAGRYDIWKIRRDGGELEAVTRDRPSGIFALPRLSPDGKSVLATRLRPTMAPTLLDLSRPIQERDFAAVDIPGTEAVVPLDWLSDGRIAGVSLAGNQADAVVIFTPSDKSVRRIPIARLFPSAVVADRYVFAADERGHAHFIDLTTGAIRGGSEVKGAATGFFSPDGSTLYTVRADVVTNIWLLK